MGQFLRCLNVKDLFFNIFRMKIIIPFIQLLISGDLIFIYIILKFTLDYGQFADLLACDKIFIDYILNFICNLAHLLDLVCANIKLK